MASRYCEICERQTIFENPKVNHILHVILSVVTVGFWLPMWFLIALASGMSRLTCSQCGQKSMKKKRSTFQPRPTVADDLDVHLH